MSLPVIDDLRLRYIVEAAAQVGTDKHELAQVFLEEAFMAESEEERTYWLSLSGRLVPIYGG